jgi:transcription-repair coupling factor (superfamily II helicase)
VWILAKKLKLGTKEETLRQFVKCLANNNKIKEISELISRGNSLKIQAIDAFRSPLIAAIYQLSKKTLVVVYPNQETAEDKALVFQELLGEENADCFVALDTLSHQNTLANLHCLWQRSQILTRLRQSKPMLITISIQNLLQKLDAREKSLKPISITVGQEINLSKITKLLVDFGYESVSLVEQPGQFAQRGSLIDVFIPGKDKPARIDWFADEVESIRFFSLDDQKSTTQLNSISIFPCRLVASQNPTLNENYQQDNAGVKDSFNFKPNGSFLQLIKEPTLIIDEPKLVWNQAETFITRQKQLFEDLNDKCLYENFYLKESEINAQALVKLDVAEIASLQSDFKFACQRPNSAYGRFEIAKKQLKELVSKNFAVLVILRDEGTLKRVSELLKNSELPVVNQLKAGQIVLSVGNLEQGFIFPEEKVAVIGSNDIFPVYKRKAAKLPIPVRTHRLVDFSDLKAGDYVVHRVHGIAIYQGICRQEVEGTSRDYLLLEYAAGDKLYIPVDQLEKLSRYIGAEGAPPKITRLGSSQWLKATHRARQSVKKLAIDLLSLYRQRLKSKGFCFSPDSQWQRELEAAFPYKETTDQLLTIDQVKHDMQTEKPMDRLVCGDVGYGKTEVAVRAAFKAILDGKQVLVLAPTTILAQQHYLTFKERLEPFPVEMDMLSRFKSSAEQKQIVSKLKQGLLDLVIGTHRLLQADIQFKDLGLVIVDEEQRFGVSHKEKLKQLRTSVDVLTLSATPIPRTLQMALTGIRDLSIIDTPPEGRSPIITWVGAFDVNVIVSAIRQELNRGGQVFYLHNRVNSLKPLFKKLKSLIPEAKIGLAHGQMPELELEKIMLNFLAHKIDILLCTTIIESGIDVANANTLIVEGADNLGLAQLYQLRGRVGRSRHQAYAYFTYDSKKALTPQAIERLKTIAEFTELGSGFKVALRDLQIRGAGNLLGPEQHGHIAAVGFELYCQMLSEVVAELKGYKPADQTIARECKVALPIEALIPSNYISEAGLRVEIYRRISVATSKKQIENLSQEITDRFGSQPEPVKNLFKIAQLRLQAKKLGITALQYHSNCLTIEVSKTELLGLLANSGYKFKLNKALNVGRLQRKFTRENLIPFLLTLLSGIIPPVNNLGRLSN